MANQIEPFRIDVPEEVLVDLRERLARTRYPDSIPGVGWAEGTDPAYLREICAYWRDEFDWRAAEASLNEIPQYRTEIDGLRVHFAHIPSREPGALPLLLSHGWPGSFMEFLKVIGPLTDPVAHGGSAQDAFHVVLPSIPGFGFSDKPQAEGWTARRIASAFNEVMARLGYDRYGVQGGDWGGVITPQMADLAPDKVVGLHLNTVSALPPAKNPMDGVLPEEVARVERFQHFLDNDNGYFEIQSTKPVSLGAAFDDSPSGLAAWIIERFYALNDAEGDFEESFSKDEMLTNIMIYWVTQTFTSSARIYLEGRKEGDYGVVKGRVTVPTGGALFPKEILVPPRVWADRSFNIVRWTEMPRGGHFAALEVPDLLVGDLREFFRPLRGAGSDSRL